MYKKYLTREQAIQKLRQYCGYQERSHNDVRERLFNLGVTMSWHDEIIATLVTDNYLNEERFAIQFAGGKFRINQWGREKIKQELKRKQVSDFCLKKALNQIDDNEYSAVLQRLADKKYESLEKEEEAVRKQKTINYLLQKGYEADLVFKLVRKK